MGHTIFVGLGTMRKRLERSGCNAMQHGQDNGWDDRIESIGKCCLYSLAERPAGVKAKVDPEPSKCVYA